jgi:hypothetical protein
MSNLLPTCPRCGGTLSTKRYCLTCNATVPAIYTFRRASAQRGAVLGQAGLAEARRTAAGEAGDD